MIQLPLAALGTATALLVTAHGTWWTLLSLVALPPPRTPRPPSRRYRFTVLVPAHNEERMIAACIHSLQSAALNHTVDLVVIADNGTDQTAAIAAACGAHVLERNDPIRRGKGYALDFGIAACSSAPAPEAVIVVDADTQVSPNFFDAIAERLDTGAQVVQVHYRVASGDESLVRLRRLAFLLVHYARPLGAQRLGLGTTLKGNGMAFRWEVIRSGFGGAGITEDAAATLALARRGIAIEFVPTASVWGYMAGDYDSARAQDMRWEGGRMTLLARAAETALFALIRGRISCAASAAELAALPLTLLGALSLLPLTLSALGVLPIWLGAIAPISLITYITCGLAAARPRRGDLRALLGTPRYVVHKLAIYRSLLRSRPATWERTRRR